MSSGRGGETVLRGLCARRMMKDSSKAVEPIYLLLVADMASRARMEE